MTAQIISLPKSKREREAARARAARSQAAPAAMSVMAKTHAGLMELAARMSNGQGYAECWELLRDMTYDLDDALAAAGHASFAGGAA